jgi:DnaJ-class molecular chaperone
MTCKDYGQMNAFGNLFVKLDVRMPEHLNEREVALFEQLASLRK